MNLPLTEPGRKLVKVLVNWLLTAEPKKKRLSISQIGALKFVILKISDRRTKKKKLSISQIGALKFVIPFTASH